MSYEKCLLTFNDATGLSLSEDERKAMMLSMLRARERITKARIKAIEEARSQMTESETIAADLVIKAVRGRPFQLATLADKLRMTKSGASKVLHRMLAKVGK